MLHVSWDSEVDRASLSDIAVVTRWGVVLLLDFYDLADLNKEKNGEPNEDEEDGHEADDGLVVGYFFYFSILEEEVDELVLHLYCYVLLLIGLTIRDHFN